MNIEKHKLFFILSLLFLIILCVEIIYGNTIDNNNLGILPIHLNIGQSENDNKEEVHLEDFFWTGSGDGPPDYLKNIHTGIIKGKDVIVKTETIVATVYVDGKNDIDNNPICTDCGNNGIPLNYSATDRRYWLLTVLSGYIQPKDYISLEDKLAKLYRIAFTRQQSLHLGLGNESSQQIKLDFSNNRYKRHQINDTITTKNNSKIELNPHEESIQTNENNLYENNIKYSSKSDDDINAILKSTISLNNSNNDINIKKSSDYNIKMPSSLSTSNAQYFYDYNDNNEKSIYGKNQIRILLHNISLLTEDDIQNWDENLYEHDINDKRDSRPLENQTEIIYSVFVNGKPVIATTAADDMKLVSEDEVTTIMGKTVFMKAEPYLREPQATPLIPSMTTGKPTFLAYIQNNSILIGIISIAFMLIFLLMLALLLMTRAKRQRSADLRRISARSELLSDNQPTHRDFDTTRTDATALSRVDFTDSNRGIHNFGFEHESKHQSKTKRPNISFPLPPTEKTRPHSSSTESTSDSSVYCPVNRPNIDLQHMLDEKAAKLFDKKKKSKLNQNEPIYTAVVSGSAGAKKRDKKLKQRRHYLTENRVGSIEDNSSADTSLSNESMYGDGNKQNYEHNEAFNLHNNYNRNKVLNNRVFNDKLYDSVHEDVGTPSEAINREIIKALHGEKSSETGSIGSFLSMGSIKSFPKNTLPEPLNRVLDPVSVTYYDHLENIQHQSKGIKTIATIERAPRNYQKNSNAASQSDNPDPGVLGPIVWEIHKKKMEQKESDESPIHDPAETRNRYEGLLEDVVQLYDDLPPIPRIPGKRPKNFNKDFRGKSAIVSSALNRSNIDNRPLTAGVDKTIPSNNSTQPPTPNRAWSSGQQSPLVRPLSAGPFHRPEPPSVDMTRILASQSTEKAQLSAAPLIEAIQNELQKFKRENSQ